MATILTTSMPAVIDALLATIRALDEVTGTPPIPVYDGLPGPGPGDTFIQIGGVDVATADGHQDWASLGTVPGAAPARDERYTINGYVSAYVGGSDAATTGASDAQQQARNTVFTLVSAIETALRNDPKLTVGLGGNGLGTGWVAFTATTLEQTTIDDPVAGLGRRAVVNFGIEVYKRLFTTS